MPKFKLPSGIDLFYDTFFSTDVGGSEWIIFISGLGDSSIIWTDYAKELSLDGYNVLVFDNRDVGQSSVVESDYTLYDMADDLLSLMNGLKIYTAHLVGHSMGAIIAQLVLLKDSEKVNSLTLIAGADSRKFINLDIISRLISPLTSNIQNDVESDHAYRIRLMHALEFAFSSIYLKDEIKIEKIIEHAISYPHRQKCSAYARQFFALSTFDEVKNSYDGPVLLINGSEDKITPPDAQTALLKQFPQARHVLEPGMAHCLNTEMPAKYRSQILGFLSTHRPALPYYLNVPSGLSPLVIPRGTYLEVLKQIEGILPELLMRGDWKTVDVDYSYPRVERVWLQYGFLRINLHRIHAAKSSKTLFHKHPWPSSMRILHGVYEMGIGFGVEESVPPLATTIMLNEGTAYEMVSPDGWHYVSPVSDVTYSLMVSGCPWPGREKKSSFQLKPLSEGAKEEIIGFFKKKYPGKPVELMGDSLADQPYIFSDVNFEMERLKRLNEVYNPNTKSILIRYLKTGMNVFEIGFGTGEIAEWIVQQIGYTGKYTGIDISDENFAKIKTKIPEAILIKRSVVDFDFNGTLKDEKFDIIFFRWVLAYTPKEKHASILGQLYQRLKPGGRLICEEFDLYAAHCTDAKDRSIRVSPPAFTEWVDLSRKVDAQFDANFGLGSKIAHLCEDIAGDPNLVTTTKFQGFFDSRYKKQILSIGMRSARETLVGAGLKREDSYNSLITELELLAEDSEVSVNYIEDTSVVVLKGFKK